MKKHKFFNIQIGARLLLAGLAIATGNMVALGLALFMPVFSPVNPMLGITAEDSDALNKLFAKAGEENKQMIKDEVQALAKGFMTTSVFEEKMNAVGLTEKAIKELTEAVQKQGETLRAMESNKGKDAPQKSLEELVIEKAAEIKQIGTSTGKIITIQAPVQKAVTRAGLTGSTLGMMLPGIGELPYISSVMRPLFRTGQVGPNSNGVIRYIDQATIARNAAFVAEGAVKPESSITWTQQTFQVEKLADSVVVTKEAWEDIDFIQSEVRRLLDLNLVLAEDNALYDGTGVSPQIKGIYTYAPVFDAAAYAAAAGMPKFQNGNLYDLIAVLKAVIMLDQGGKYDPKTVLMNPMDILRYKLLKATDGHYLLPPFISADGMSIDGIRVVESSQVTANTLVIGDFRYGTIYDREGVTIEMGHVNDQFIRNTFTILAEKRFGLLVRNQDLSAFRKVTSISAAITAITTP